MRVRCGVTTVLRHTFLRKSDATGSDWTMSKSNPCNPSAIGSRLGAPDERPLSRRRLASARPFVCRLYGVHRPRREPSLRLRFPVPLARPVGFGLRGFSFSSGPWIPLPLRPLAVPRSPFRTLPPFPLRQVIGHRMSYPPSDAPCPTPLPLPPARPYPIRNSEFGN
jgi:hypothetical protein